jgi:hypothetical protein
MTKGTQWAFAARGDRQVAAIIRTVRLTAAESFWYVLGCVWFGAMYLAKVPAKKALCEAGLGKMTSAEKFWYVVACIAFGAGYFLKVPLKKALSEVPYMPGGGPFARAYDSNGPRQRVGGRQPPRHSRAGGQHGVARAPLRAMPPAQRQPRHDTLSDEAWP